MSRQIMALRGWSNDEAVEQTYFPTFRGSPLYRPVACQAPKASCTRAERSVPVCYIITHSRDRAIRISSGPQCCSSDSTLASAPGPCGILHLRNSYRRSGWSDHLRYLEACSFASPHPPPNLHTCLLHLFLPGLVTCMHSPRGAPAMTSQCTAQDRGGASGGRELAPALSQCACEARPPSQHPTHVCRR